MKEPFISVLISEEKLNERIAQLGEQISKDYEGNSQFVTAVVSGNGKLKSINIDMEELASDDREILEDMVLVAVNNAIDKMEKDKEEKFGEKIYSSEAKELGRVDVDSKYIDRVHEGFRAVVSYGLGYGYMGEYNDIGAGKTGTSQSFIDTDSDGKVDTETISTSFVGYAPYDNPKMSIVVVSPDVAIADATVTSGINRRISSKIVNKYFEIYK